MSYKLLGAVCGMALLAGCETVPPQAGSLDAGFGEVTKHNAAVQIINPDPVYPEDGAKPGDSGTKGAAAVKRYRSDEVNARHKAEVSAARATTLNTTQGTGGSGPK